MSDPTFADLVACQDRAAEAERDDLRRCYESQKKANDDMERAMLAALARVRLLEEAARDALIVLEDLAPELVEKGYASYFNTESGAGLKAIRRLTAALTGGAAPEGGR